MDIHASYKKPHLVLVPPAISHQPTSRQVITQVSLSVMKLGHCQGSFCPVADLGFKSPKHPCIAVTVLGETIEGSRYHNIEDRYQRPAKLACPVSHEARKCGSKEG